MRLHTVFPDSLYSGRLWCCNVAGVTVMLQVSTQLKQYHDDLLAACLELILALPDDIVITHLNIVIPALEVGFVCSVPLAKR